VYTPAFCLQPAGWQNGRVSSGTLALTSSSTIFAVATMFTGDEGEELSGRALAEVRQHIHRRWKDRTDKGRGDYHQQGRGR